MDFVTCDLCDDNADIVRVMSGIHWRSYGAKTVFGGEAVTVKCFEDNSRVKELLKNTEGHGRVLLVDGGGSLRHALIGDQIAAGAQANGWAGVIIYGVCRDVGELADIDLGVLALGSTPLKSVRRDEGQTDLAITIGGVTLTSGDYIYADANGVVVAPKALV